MTKNSQSNLVKIAYFDEQAAIDALQVIDGGSALEKKKMRSMQMEMSENLFWV